LLYVVPTCDLFLTLAQQGRVVNTGRNLTFVMLASL